MRLRIWSCETGSAVPSRVSLLILHTPAESGAYLRDSSRFPRRRPFICSNRHTPSSPSRVYRVTQLLTDGVHCRESAGTGPVVLKVVPVTGAAILQVTMDHLICASLSHAHYWYGVGMLINSSRQQVLVLLSLDGGWQSLSISPYQTVTPCIGCGRICDKICTLDIGLSPLMSHTKGNLWPRPLQHSISS